MKKVQNVKSAFTPKYYLFFLKISLILWNKFICNFKYIFINETGFIKKKCNNCGQINNK